MCFEHERDEEPRRSNERKRREEPSQEASTKGAHTCGTLMIMKGDKGGWQFAKSRLKDGDFSPIWINARSTAAKKGWVETTGGEREICGMQCTRVSRFA